MKNGILFFLNMGNITMGARIAILPLIYLTFFQVRPFGVAYFTCFVLLILSVLLALIPAPSDRKALRTLQAFHFEHNEEMMSRCGFANDGEILRLFGYEEYKNMRIKRAVGRDVIYPHAVAIAFAFHLDKGRLLIGKKSLLKRMPPEYFFFKEDMLYDMKLSVTVEGETEEIAKLVFEHASFPSPLTVYVKNDFRVRDLVNFMEQSKKF
ncbi:MAG: hypothetical protein IKA76_06020 [Clostridia bacterium]|nr:hypothetical protein [Clostridia bacterium]